MSEDTDHIDMDGCRQRNIEVVKLSEIPVQLVADLTIGLIILCTLPWLKGLFFWRV